MSQSVLTIIVGEEPPSRDTTHDVDEDFQEESIPAPLKRLFSHKAKDVDLGPLKDGLDTVQGQLDELLGKVTSTQAGGYRVQSVAVALGITAGGTIGVVTAGVTASLTLTFVPAGAAK